jgi:hypothetical protein
MFFFADTSSSGERIEDGECGVIYNIIMLYSDYKVAEALALFTHCIAELLINRKDVEKAKIYVNAVDAKGPDMSYEEIMRALLSVQPNDKWSYENIMKDIKKTCFSEDRTWAPDFDAGADKVALHFQVSFLFLSCSFLTGFHKIRTIGHYVFAVLQNSFFAQVAFLKWNAYACVIFPPYRNQSCLNKPA